MAREIDVALLRVDAAPEELEPLVLGDSRELQVGQKVMAIGNAMGLHNTLSVGIVSACRRSVQRAPLELEASFIQTDAAINPGNSGGPLLNSDGQVVGIDDAVLTRAQSIGFAVPVESTRHVLPDLIAMGYPTRTLQALARSSGGVLLRQARRRSHGYPVCSWNFTAGAPDSELLCPALFAYAASVAEECDSPQLGMPERVTSLSPERPPWTSCSFCISDEPDGRNRDT